MFDQWNIDHWIGAIQTLVGAIGLAALWHQLRQGTQVAKAQSYITIRETLAQLNQRILENQEIGELVGEDQGKAFFDMLAAYFEMPFILKRLKVIDKEVFEVERRSLEHLLGKKFFRDRFRLSEGLYDKEYLDYVKSRLAWYESQDATENSFATMTDQVPQKTQ